MNAVVIVVAAVVCLFGGTMAEDKVAVVITGSEDSTGSVLGCKVMSAPGTKALVKFQAVRQGGVEYSRVTVSSARMNFSDVTEMNFGSLSFPECVRAVDENKMNAFSFESGQCMAYNIGDGICPCTKGDTVLYLATSAIKGNSSYPKTLRVAKERAFAPLPAGYVRKIIYPIVSMTGDNFMVSSSSCEDVLKLRGAFVFRPALLHTVNGKCYYTIGFSNFPCNSCEGTATDVIFKEPSANQTNLLSNCGKTITCPRYFFDDFLAGLIVPEVIYSHEGYGCIPYPDPVSDDKCSITVEGSPRGETMTVKASNHSIDIDVSAGNDCNGDQLYVSFDSQQGTTCRKIEEFYNAMNEVSTNFTISFERKPSYNNTSVNKGFALFPFVYRNF